MLKYLQDFKHNSKVRYRHFRNKTLTLKNHLESNIPTLK